MNVIDKTQSLCPICLKVIATDIVNIEGRIFLFKTCPIHGFFKSKHPWLDSKDYLGIKKSIANSYKVDFADNLVLNLNSLCNMNCPFCFARANEYYMEEPDLNKIKQILKNFKGTSVYLSGGEPTLRQDIFDIIILIKKMGYEAGLFTNGKALIDLGYVAELKKAGLDLVILQFDTLDDNQYELLRGERLLLVKFKVIDNLRIYSIPVYLFIMLSKGVNVNQIKSLFDYAMRNRDVIKLINLNPIWEMGRIGNHNEMSASDVLYEVEKQTNFKFEDFIASTEFSYHFFEIIRKIRKKGGRKHPQCEIRCYAIATSTSLIPISRILNLERLNKKLNKINKSLNKDSSILNLTKLLFMIPYPFLLRYFLKNSLFRRVLLKSIMFFISKNLMFLDVVSIIVGTFHTSDNIDLKMVDTCNLFSDYKSNNISSCLRQIYFLRDISNQEITVK